MALLLHTPNENVPTPKPVWLILSCDGKHGLFQGEKVTATFKEDGYIANRSAATAAGWVITDMGKVYCPICKGRRRDE